MCVEVLRRKEDGKQECGMVLRGKEDREKCGEAGYWIDG